MKSQIAVIVAGLMIPLSDQCNKTNDRSCSEYEVEIPGIYTAG